ncbi:MAG: dihydrofolate reductase [Zoogloeaceae bacterium]|jgi:dihydrofolate reductase|nr:dihydrofolate reductase [Zoogloeaceae bacterium]
MTSESCPRLTLIAAVARNRIIGAQNRLPWHLPEDLRHFRDATLGHPVLMGRHTWESLPEKFRPLPGRLNLVLSRQTHYTAPGARVFPELSAALKFLTRKSPEAAPGLTPEIFVIGGAKTYADALPFAHRLLLTEIDLDVEGDARFPEFSRTNWRETKRETHSSAAGYSFHFVTYTRP